MSTTERPWLDPHATERESASEQQETPTRQMTIPGQILAADRRSMASESGWRIEYSVLLVSGAVGDYKAYMGSGSDEFIIAYGDPLSFDEAKAHFPIGLEKRRYRR